MSQPSVHTRPLPLELPSLPITPLGCPKHQAELPTLPGPSPRWGNFKPVYEPQRAHWAATELSAWHVVLRASGPEGRTKPSKKPQRKASCVRAASLSRVRLCATPWTYLPGSAVRGIGVGARPSARGSSRPRDGNCVSTSPALQLGSLPLVPAESPRKHQAAGQRPSQDVGPAPCGG